MDTLLEKIEQILQLELGIHDTLITSSEQFNLAIKQEDIGSIHKYSADQDEKINLIAKYEDQRIHYCTSLCAELGITTPQPRLTTILERIPQQWRERLEKIQFALKQKTKMLARLSVANRVLIEEALLILNNTFTLIQNAQKKYHAYGMYGKSTAVPAMRTIINQTA